MYFRKALDFHVNRGSYIHKNCIYVVSEIVSLK